MAGDRRETARGTWPECRLSKPSTYRHSSFSSACAISTDLTASPRKAYSSDQPEPQLLVAYLNFVIMLHLPRHVALPTIAQLIYINQLRQPLQ